MIITQLSAYEVELLASLIMQLIELVSDGEPEGFATAPATTDPFEEIVKDLEGEPDEPGPLEDPVLKRLFPEAYPADTAASADFRRFTERDLKATKVAEARVVLDRLATTELGARDLKIPANEVESWLRTLTMCGSLWRPGWASATRLRPMNWPHCQTMIRGASW